VRYLKVSFFGCPGGWDEGWGGEQNGSMKPLGAGEARAVFLFGKSCVLNSPGAIQVTLYVSFAKTT
jgi:hypothetical protein